MAEQGYLVPICSWKHFFYYIMASSSCGISFSMESVICEYHKYRSTREAAFGELLSCQREHKRLAPGVWATIDTIYGSLA